MPDKLFEIGVLHITLDAMIALIDHDISIVPLLERHQSGDWGEVDDEDKAANDKAVAEGTRLLSSYVICNGCCNTRIWLITEADRTLSTLLLPSEY